MAVREGYKQTEVGVIPEDWEVGKIGSLTSKIGSGITPTGGEKVYKKNGRPFVRSQNVLWGRMSLRDMAFIDENTHKSFDGTEIKKYDVLLNISGASIGRSVVAYKSVIGGNVNQHVCIIRPIESHIHYHYLCGFLLSEKGQKFINDFQAGGNRQGLNFMQIASIVLPIPPLPEQKAIATPLSDIDDLIDSLSRLIDKKKNIKQGAMQELLTGKKRLEGFSGEWEFRSMGNLFKFSGGHSASREQLSKEGHSYLHYGDIHGSAKTFVDVKDEYLEIPKLNIELNKISKDKLLQDGDVVFVDASEDDEGVNKHVVIRNPHGIPFISGLHTIIAKSKTNELNNLYKEYCFQSEEVKKQFAFYAVGIKVSGISRSNIIKIVLKIPPTIEEQTAIATILSDMDTEIEKLQVKLDKYKAIKQGMMQELLTGRIRLLEGV